MNEQIVAPAPGSIPTKNPMSEPRQSAPNESFQSWRFGKRLRKPSFASEKTCLHRLLDVHQDLRDGKEPNGHPDETDAVEQVHVVEGEPGHPADGVDPDAGDQRAPGPR